MRNYIDQLQSTNLFRAVRMAVRLVTLIDEQPPGEQLSGLAILFLLTCRRFGTDPRIALEAADRMLTEARRQRITEINALGVYLVEEIPDRI